MHRQAQRLVRSGIDVAILAGSWFVAFQVRFEGALPTDQWDRLWLTLPYVVGLKLATMSLLAIGRHSWRYFAMRQALLLTLAMVVSSSFVLAARLFGASRPYPFTDATAIPIGVIVIDLLIATSALIAVRVARRFQSEEAEARSHPAAKGAKRVLLIGAGRAGAMVARELRARPDIGMRPIGFLDDDRAKHGQLIMDIPVIGSPEDLQELVEERHIDEVVITIAGATGTEIRRLRDLCERAGLPPKIIPGVYEIVGGKVNLSRIRPVAIEDLLRREPVQLNTSGIRDLVAHDVVMVTGAGGSIGSELCRQLCLYDPKTLVLVEQAENALWAIHRELEAEFPGVTVVPAIADVCDQPRIEQLMLHHRPTTVFHAAAHKHVPMMEWNPGEAIKNNVGGTKVVADAALASGVARFVMISTNKAVNPTSIMGATKRIAERYVQHLAQESGRSFVSVRFGNVLDSAGSVVPIFREQIARGGPVTVTDPDMVRYFMTIPEAAQLVIQAAALGEGSEIFVLDMGEPVKIVDLARDLIRLSGYSPDSDIHIEFTGVRPGEKLYEELNLSDEGAARTKHPKIWIGSAFDQEWPDTDEPLTTILSGPERLTPEKARSVILGYVPEYAPEAVS